MTATTLDGVLLTGTHGSRPAASAVSKGALYAETDTGQTYQSDGSSTWTAYGAAAGSLAKGTSFPGSPSTNDLYFRTDRGLLYYYDGTRWLTTTLYHEVGQQSSDGTQPWSTSPQAIHRNVMWSGAYDLWLVDAYATFFGSGLSGSNYWILTMDKGDTAGTFTTVATLNNASATDGEWTMKTASIGALLGSKDATLRFTITKNNTPNATYVSAAYTYRLVG